MSSEKIIVLQVVGGIPTYLPQQNRGEVLQLRSAFMTAGNTADLSVSLGSAKIRLAKLTALRCRRFELSLSFGPEDRGACLTCTPGSTVMVRATVLSEKVFRACLKRSPNQYPLDANGGNIVSKNPSSLLKNLRNILYVPSDHAVATGRPVPRASASVSDGEDLGTAVDWTEVFPDRSPAVVTNPAPERIISNAIPTANVSRVFSSSESDPSETSDDADTEIEDYSRSDDNISTKPADSRRVIGGSDDSSSSSNASSDSCESEQADYRPELASAQGFVPSPRSSSESDAGSDHHDCVSAESDASVGEEFMSPSSSSESDSSSDDSSESASAASQESVVDITDSPDAGPHAPPCGVSIYTPDPKSRLGLTSPCSTWSYHSTDSDSFELTPAKSPKPVVVLMVENVAKGGADSRAAEQGDKVRVRYSVSITRADPKPYDLGVIAFKVGKGQVLAGLDEGIVGMKQGDIRRISVPRELGYIHGFPGHPEVSGSLIYEVELLMIK